MNKTIRWVRNAKMQFFFPCNKYELTENVSVCPSFEKETGIGNLGGGGRGQKLLIHFNYLNRT